MRRCRERVQAMIPQRAAATRLLPGVAPSEEFAFATRTAPVRAGAAAFQAGRQTCDPRPCTRRPAQERSPANALTNVNALINKGDRRCTVLVPGGTDLEHPR